MIGGHGGDRKSLMQEEMKILGVLKSLNWVKEENIYEI